MVRTGGLVRKVEEWFMMTKSISYPSCRLKGEFLFSVSCVLLITEELWIGEQPKVLLVAHEENNRDRGSQRQKVCRREQAGSGESKRQ